MDVSSDEIIPGNSTILQSDRLATLNPQSEKLIAQWMLDQNLSIMQASDAADKFAPLQLNGLVPAEGGLFISSELPRVQEAGVLSAT